MKTAFGFAAAAFTAMALACTPALAETIANPVAQFDGLDKITGRITSFDVYVDETVQFGALQITPRVCYTRPESETPRTSVFLEVDQVDLDGNLKRIFTGWMFAESPALNSIDHPIYDVWLTDCKKTSNVPPPDNGDSEGDTAASAPADSGGDASAQ